MHFPAAHPCAENGQLQSETKEFSIFHRIDKWGNDPTRDAIANNNQILEPPDLVWAVVHKSSVRGTRVQLGFEPRALHVGEESDDLVSNEDPTDPGVIRYSESKLGGQAFVERVGFVGAAIDQLVADGFLHLLQIGMHGADLIDGFPWDPGYLNVWAKDPHVPASYRYCIQQ